MHSLEQVYPIESQESRPMLGGYQKFWTNSDITTVLKKTLRTGQITVYKTSWFFLRLFGCWFWTFFFLKLNQNQRLFYSEYVQKDKNWMLWNKVNNRPPTYGWDPLSLTPLVLFASFFEKTKTKGSFILKIFKKSKTHRLFTFQNLINKWEPKVIKE
jgi:hypothetical protein